MENKQNSSNNQGVGVFGNNTNTQSEFNIDSKHELKKAIDELKNKSLPKWVYWIWLISVVALGISLAAIFMNSGLVWNVEITSISIILAFVGILATFIVVGNYNQVNDIKKEYKAKIEEIKDNFTSQLADIKTESNSIYEKYKIIILAIIQYERGNFCLRNSAKLFSLYSYIRSLDLLNLVREDEITDILINSICELKSNDVNEDANKQIHLSQTIKRMFIESLRTSNHKRSIELIKWIETMPEPPKENKSFNQ